MIDTDCMISGDCMITARVGGGRARAKKASGGGEVRAQRAANGGSAALALSLVDVGQVPARVLRLRIQVEVRAVGDALDITQLRAGEAEAVLDVDCSLRVVRELLVRVVVVAQVLRRDAQVEI